MTTRRRNVYRTCTLCEAIRRLTLEVEGDRIVSARGDDMDVFSRGYVCPKAWRSPTCTTTRTGCGRLCSE